MKVWMLPSYKSQTPSSQMRVHQIAQYLKCDKEIIPYNWTVEQKLARLENVGDRDYVLIQKWRNDFNRAEHISKLKGVKIFDMDDITGDAEAIELAKCSDILFMANHYLVEWARTNFPDKEVQLVPTGIAIPEGLAAQPGKPVALIAKYGVDRYIPHIAKIVDWKDLHENYGIEIQILGITDAQSEKQATELIGDFCTCLPLVPLGDFWKQYGNNLASATLGIMPLRKKAQGKSGFSVLTMMAAGLPVIASPYGECDYIIDHGINGYLADTNQDWHQSIVNLIENPEIRADMSREAMKTIIEKYTVHSIAEKMEKFLHEKNLVLGPSGQC